MQLPLFHEAPPIATILGFTPWDFLTTPLCWVLVPCQLLFPQANFCSSSSPTRPPTPCVHAVHARVHTSLLFLQPLQPLKLAPSPARVPSASVLVSLWAPSHFRYCVSDATRCLPDATAIS